MSATNFNDLRRHIGHNIVCVGYQSQDPDEVGIAMENVAIECMDCNEVLLDFDMGEIRERLEYLRKQIEDECISYEEIAELQGLKDYIDEGDVLLLEWAGVPENN